MHYSSCGSIISSLTDACRECVIFSMGISLQSVSSCSTTEKASRYETTYGLMLLSKKEMKVTDYGGITNQSQFRGYLKATVSLLYIYNNCSSDTIDHASTKYRIYRSKVPQ